MTVKRIVANIAAEKPSAVAQFYERIFGLHPLMDFGWIVTLGDAASKPASAPIQLSIASEGGSGTPLPAISIEVDDLDETLQRVRAAGLAPEYGPVVEPWGVRRFFLRDPGGTLINVLAHDAADLGDARG